LKTIQYFLIAYITILFCKTSESSQLDLALSGLILLLYFLGKVQNMQSRFMMLQIQSRTFQPQVYKPNMNLELGIIVLSLGLFVFLAIRPEFAENPVSLWFYRNITDIEHTPIFGFIFKVVGFFFTITMLLRLVNAFTVLLSGQAFNNRNNNGNNGQNDQQDNDRFDDYEEMK